MNNDSLYELCKSFSMAKEKFYCKKKCCCILGMVLFALLIITLLLFLWCTPSLKIHFSHGMLNYGRNIGSIAFYQSSSLYTWSKLLIGFFLWLTLAWGTCCAFKCMKEYKVLYMTYHHKELMVESYIKMAGKLDSADKERLSAALLDCVKSDPIHTLATYERKKKHQ